VAEYSEDVAELQALCRSAAAALRQAKQTRDSETI
jgi:hypothetical protein